MIKNKDLIGFGFNDRESAVYLSLLELGVSPMSRVVKKSGIKRTTLYDVLESLKKKGFVSVTKRKGGAFYMPEDPRIIGEKIKEQERLFTKLLPEILSITNTHQKKPRIRFFEGAGGLKEIYKDSLKYEDQELLAWIPEELELFDQRFLDDLYLVERLHKKIWMRVIAPDEPFIREYKSRDEQALCTTKVIPDEAFKLDVQIMLYGENSVGILSFSDEVGLIVESKTIYKTLKSIFEWQWAGL